MQEKAMEIADDTKQFEARGRNQRTPWLGVIGILLLLFAGVALVINLLRETTGLGLIVVGLCSTFVGAVLLVWHQDRTRIVIKIERQVGAAQAAAWQLSVIGWGGLVGEILPQSMQYWYWAKSRMRDGDLLRKVHGFVQVQLADGTFVGFVSTFDDQHAFPSH